MSSIILKINENNLKYFYPAKTTRCKPYKSTKSNLMPLRLRWWQIVPFA